MLANKPKAFKIVAFVGGRKTTFFALSSGRKTVFSAQLKIGEFPIGLQGA
jgi:hypothetical protein